MARISYVDPASLTDPVAQAATNEIFEPIGRAIANAHLLLDLDAAVLFGGVTAVGEPFRLAVERAFLRCALIANLRWEKRWTESSEQPTAGFTIPSSETDEEIDQLCETYFKADDEGRKLIQVLARLSVDGRA